MLEINDKVHLITRRNFADDLRRHFIGKVVAASETVARLEGYVFVFDPTTVGFVRRKNKRLRVVSLSDAGNLINILPASIDLEKLTYRVSPENRLVVTDGAGFEMDINEFGKER